MSNLLIRNIGILVQVSDGHPKLSKGKEMAHLPCIQNAYLLLEGDQIAAFGPMSQCPERAAQVLDAAGGAVFPAWCDSHTHIVFATTREEEFRDRIQGMSYEEIAVKGGGILNSARKLQACSEEELYQSALGRLNEVIDLGTGAIEIKSGYGLSLESELKMLRVIRRLKSVSPIPIKATFLGAHALPMAYKNDRESYIHLIINEMIPQVAAEGLADYCDVFCDKGFFSPAETERILEAGWKMGLKPKIHANELGYTGGVQAGVAQNAISVDHLEYCGDAEIESLKKGNTLPVALPSCAFFLGIPYCPGRNIIDAGLPLVLASDYNPGSSPSGNMHFVISLACIKMKLLPEEALNAATINGAFSMELQAELGSISVGKTANLWISKPISSLALLPYAFGSNLVQKVVIKGKDRNIKR
jgi:imidazolonepropionase